MQRSRLLSSLVLAAASLAAALPAPADAQGRPSSRETPYATTFSINVTSGSGASAHAPDVVPIGKRLVIEYVSVIVFAQPGERPYVHLNDNVNGHSRAYWVPLTLTDPSTTSAEVYRSSQQVKLYFDGTGIGGPGGQCSRNIATFTPLSCGLTISGYLIDK